MVANFRTEDAQRRLLTAVIAAHPELKLNFKAIAQHFGPEDWGKDGIEHFFRPLKKDALVVRTMVKSGQPAKEFFDNKAGKGGAASGSTTAASAGGGSSVPATPKNRKRAAASAPSTGRSTASKKARASASKPVPVAAPVINLDDDDDEDNEFPPIPMDTPTQGPRFTDLGAKQFWGNDAQAPALDATQAETPTEEEDLKPHTPSDAAAYSFSQAPSYSGVGIGAYNLDTYPISQPSFVADASYHKSQGWQPDDFVDDEV